MALRETTPIINKITKIKALNTQHLAYTKRVKYSNILRACLDWRCGWQKMRARHFYEATYWFCQTHCSYKHWLHILHKGTIHSTASSQYQYTTSYKISTQRSQTGQTDCKSRIEMNPTSFATGEVLSSLSYINASKTCLNSSYASLNTKITVRIRIKNNQ